MAPTWRDFSDPVDNDQLIAAVATQGPLSFAAVLALPEFTSLSNAEVDRALEIGIADGRLIRNNGLYHKAGTTPARPKARSQPHHSWV